MELKSWSHLPAVEAMKLEVTRKLHALSVKHRLLEVKMIVGEIVVNVRCCCVFNI